MRNTTRRNAVAAAALSVAFLQLLLLPFSDALKPAVQLANSVPSSTMTSRCAEQQQQLLLLDILSLRGGDDDVVDDESASTLDVEIDVDEIESSDEDEEEEEEDEVEEKLDPKLVRAAQAASSKVKAKAVKAAQQASKKAVASTLLANKPKVIKKEKTGFAKLFQIPYIIKACLNPFIFVQMTRGYWKSLVNHKYGEAVKVQCFEDVKSDKA
jgi:hypothetical protein